MRPDAGPARGIAGSAILAAWAAGRSRWWTTGAAAAPKIPFKFKNTDRRTAARFLQGPVAGHLVAGSLHGHSRRVDPVALGRDGIGALLDMFKRTIDIAASFAGLLVTAPVILPAMLLIWLQDLRSPLYLAARVGQDGRMFRMVKLRSMVVDADRHGVDSTAAHDPRITAIGRVVRHFKLDELCQLWNVLKGDMSLVGPRPNVERETARYTPVEQRLLSVPPGITDMSSIVFSDLSEILKYSRDPNLDYNRLVRPWKSWLGLFYIDHRSTPVDLVLIALTGVAMVSRRTALSGVSGLLRAIGAPEELCRISRRSEELRPRPPPGAEHVVAAADMAAPTLPRSNAA